MATNDFVVVNILLLLLLLLLNYYFCCWFFFVDVVANFSILGGNTVNKILTTTERGKDPQSGKFSTCGCARAGEAANNAPPTWIERMKAEANMLRHSIT